MESRNCINFDVIKSKHSEEVVGKIRSKLQITHVYVCKFNTEFVKSKKRKEIDTRNQ